MKRVITEVELQKQADNNELTVSRDMVLTPGAREYASRNGIVLRYQDKPSQPTAEPISEEQLAAIVEQIVVEEVTEKVREPASESDGTPPSAPSPPPPVPEAAAQDIYVETVLSEKGRDSVLNCDPAQDTERAIVTVIGKNRPGLVARISAAVADCGGDLADMSQVIIDDYFSMIFIVDMTGLNDKDVSFRVFKEKLQDEATRLGQVQVLVMHEGVFKAMHKV